MKRVATILLLDDDEQVLGVCGHIIRGGNAAISDCDGYVFCSEACLKAGDRSWALSDPSDGDRFLVEGDRRFRLRQDRRWVAWVDGRRARIGRMSSHEHPRQRDPACVERWPECEDGAYDPRCCRFPKECSCESYPPGLRVDVPADLADLTTPDERLHA